MASDILDVEIETRNYTVMHLKQPSKYAVQHGGCLRGRWMGTGVTTTTGSGRTATATWTVDAGKMPT